MRLKPDQELQAIAVIKTLKLFAGCTEAQLKAMASRLDMQSFVKTKVIIMEQEISKTLYVLLQGSVGIWRRQQGEKKLVATLQAPDFFGEASMFSESPANALVKAQEDCQLVALARTAFDELAANDATFGLLIEKNMEEVHTQRPPLQKRPSEEESH
jgi:CRP-like cAMP-binding protein